MYSKVLSNVMESNRRRSDAVCLIANADWVGHNWAVNEIKQCSNILLKNEVGYAVPFNAHTIPNYGCDQSW